MVGRNSPPRRKRTTAGKAMQDATSPQGDETRSHVCPECGLHWAEDPNPPSAGVAGTSWADVCPRCQVWSPSDDDTQPETAGGEA